MLARRASCRLWPRLKPRRGGRRPDVGRRHDRRRRRRRAAYDDGRGGGHAARRHVPARPQEKGRGGHPRLRNGDGDEATEMLHRKLNESGRVYLSHAKVDGRYVIRMSIGGTNTTEASIGWVKELL